MSEARFQGILIEELPILAVDWIHRAEHIRTRSTRRRGDLDVEPGWATEAALDPDRLVDVAGEGSIVVLGSCERTGSVLKVWLVPKDDMPTSGEWWGASACVANERNVRDYEQQRRGDEGHSQ